MPCVIGSQVVIDRLRVEPWQRGDLRGARQAIVLRYLRLRVHRVGDGRNLLTRCLQPGLHVKHLRLSVGRLRDDLRHGWRINAAEPGFRNFHKEFVPNRHHAARIIKHGNLRPGEPINPFAKAVRTGPRYPSGG